MGGGGRDAGGAALRRPTEALPWRRGPRSGGCWGAREASGHAPEVARGDCERELLGGAAQASEPQAGRPVVAPGQQARRGSTRRRRRRRMGMRWAGLRAGVPMRSSARSRAGSWRERVRSADRLVGAVGLDGAVAAVGPAGGEAHVAPVLLRVQRRALRAGVGVARPRPAGEGVARQLALGVALGVQGRRDVALDLLILEPGEVRGPSRRPCRRSAQMATRRAGHGGDR